MESNYKKASILIIDDDRAVCKLLTHKIQGMGHQAVSCLNLRDGIAEADAKDYDVIFLDVNLPDGNGLDILPDLRAVATAPEIIIMTGFGDPDGAELAIKNGAWDYIQKPISARETELQLNRVIKFRENLAQQKRNSVALKRDAIVGNSAPMERCFDMLAQAAGSDNSVLILGETGTGKELFARAIHDNSARAQEAFVVVDCTVLPENLVESELFGHKKGTFTGAEKDKDGLILQADKGTLFLDEVGDLPATVQKAFLRLLQERRFRPIGGQYELESDFRLVAATNRDLDAMVNAGQFRKDLLYRIRAMTIKLPPLRERGDDIRQIALYQMAKYCERNNIGTKAFTSEFIEALQTYDWPGNVRELINTMKTSLGSVGIGETLSTMHLPTPIRIHMARAAVMAGVQAQTDSDSEIVLTETSTLPLFRVRMNATEKAYLKSLMATTGFDIKESCEISGLSRSRLYALLKKHGLSRH